MLTKGSNKISGLSVLVLPRNTIATRITSKPLKDFLNQLTTLKSLEGEWFKLTISPSGPTQGKHYFDVWKTIDSDIKTLQRIFTENCAIFFIIAVEMHRGSGRVEDVERFQVFFANSTTSKSLSDKCFIINSDTPILDKSIIGYPHYEVLVCVEKDIRFSSRGVEGFFYDKIQSTLVPYNLFVKSLMGEFVLGSNLSISMFMAELCYLHKEQFLYDVRTNVSNFTQDKSRIYYFFNSNILQKFEFLAVRLKEYLDMNAVRRVDTSVVEPRKLNIHVASKFTLLEDLSAVNANGINITSSVAERIKQLADILGTVSYKYDFFVFLKAELTKFGFIYGNGYVYSRELYSRFTYAMCYPVRDFLTRVFERISSSSIKDEFLVKHLKRYVEALSLHSGPSDVQDLHIEFQDSVYSWSTLKTISIEDFKLLNKYCFKFINFKSSLFLSTTPDTCLQVLFLHFYTYYKNKSVFSSEDDFYLKSIELLYLFVITYGKMVMDLLNPNINFDKSTFRSLHIFGVSGSMKSIFGNKMLFKFFGADLVALADTTFSLHKMLNYIGKKLIILDEFSWQKLDKDNYGYHYSRDNLKVVLDFGTTVIVKTPYHTKEQKYLTIQTPVILIGQDQPPFISDLELGVNKLLISDIGVLGSERKKSATYVQDSVSFLRRTASFPFTVSFADNTILPARVLDETNQFIFFCNQLAVKKASSSDHKKDFEDFFKLCLSLNFKKTL